MINVSENEKELKEERLVSPEEIEEEKFERSLEGLRPQMPRSPSGPTRP